ncbi:MAG: lipopolysaccharide biosynthesis protein [Bacteroidetes bacterium]|nr:lipopolysaccharide biosynthesis protein [Bacteroidota bacterium]
MSAIRKNSLKTSLWIYGGFVLGAVNTFFLSHKTWFTTDENGLTRSMTDTSLLLFAFSTLGVTSYILKFFPYYSDNLPPKKNDILGIAAIISIIGFVLTAFGAWLLEPLIVRKFSTNSILLVKYFYWVLPMTFFVLSYQVLEAYAYGFHKGPFTSILKETVLRLYTSVIIILKLLGFVSFDIFIKLFAFQYAVITVVLFINLYSQDKIWLSFKISRVTQKFRKKIFVMMSLTLIVIVVGMLRQTIDAFVLASKIRLGKVAIFGLASYMVSVLQVPMRSVISITTPMLSIAWKQKNYDQISSIYKRSSINLLTFALFAFFCIWLNFTQGLTYFNINPEYLEGKWVFFLLGMVTIIEMGTGVNAQIIGTSSYWRFEFWTSILLTTLIIPLSYFLTVKYGIIGPALANIVSFTVYNFIRYMFLLKRFKMQPFSSKTAEVIIISVCCYLIIFFLLHSIAGLPGLVIRTVSFSLLFIILVYMRDITPDLKPVLNTLMMRWRKWTEKKSTDLL